MGIGKIYVAIFLLITAVILVYILNHSEIRSESIK
jgi:hypothetical protein